MDGDRFDALTRRAAGVVTERRRAVGLLAGAALGAALGRDAEPAAANRRRCPSTRRCGGACCPKGTRCENGACVAPCGNPFGCGPDSGFGGACSGRKDCFCSETAAGKSACLNVGIGVPCDRFAACGPGGSCPPGLICGTCSCGSTADLRCIAPCPPKK